MTTALPEPRHFQWVTVSNLPEDWEIVLTELGKYGYRFEDIVFFPLHGESREAAFFLPDIESAHNFASEVNEKYIGGRKVYTARKMFLSSLIQRPTVDQCVQTGSEEDLAESPVAIISRHLVDAGIQIDTEKQLVISSLPYLISKLVDGDLRQANISAISLPDPLSVPSPIDKPVMAQQQEPKAKTGFVAPSIHSSKSVAPRVNQSAKKIADTTKAPSKCSKSNMVLRNVQKGAVTDTKATLKRPISPSSAKTSAKKSEEKEYFFCDREGCNRAKDPYVMHYAYINHMEKHRQEDGARKKRGASQK